MISKLSSFLSLTTLALSSLGVVAGLHIRNVTGTQLNKRDYTSNIYYYGEDVHFNGACNTMIDNSVLVAGIDPSIYNQDRCGQSILIMFKDPDSGVQLSASAIVETTCYGCAPGDLVVTPSVFGAATSLPSQVTWTWGGGE